MSAGQTDHHDSDVHSNDGDSSQRHHGESIERPYNASTSEPDDVVVSNPYDLSGIVIGGYQLLAPVGSGSFGFVYRALDKQLNRTVALKIPRPEILEDAAKLERFHHEAKAMALLEHPHIVPVFRAQIDAKIPYIASAYCQGPDLASWIAKNGQRAAFSDAARFIANVADALDYAHRSGVLHRDVKPSNILMESSAPEVDVDLTNCVPRLTDFGLAKLRFEELHASSGSVLLGTPRYMAPEQLVSNEEETEAADIYALGLILFELLTGRLPFDEGSYVDQIHERTEGTAAYLREFRADAPKELEIICVRCLARTPSFRYSTAADLAADLNAFAAGARISANPIPRSSQVVSWCSQAKRLQAAGWFSAGFHFFIILWLLFSLFLLTAMGLFPEDLLRENIADLMKVSTTVHLPMAWLGYRLAKGARWSFWPSTIGAVITLTILMYSAFVQSFAFEYNYRDPMQKIGIFSALIAAASVDVVLHALAIPAWWTSKPGRPR